MVDLCLFFVGGVSLRNFRTPDAYQVDDKGYLLPEDRIVPLPATHDSARVGRDPSRGFFRGNDLRSLLE